MAGAQLHEPEQLPPAGTWCFSSQLLWTDEDYLRIHPDDFPAVRQRYPHGWQLLCVRYGGKHAEWDVLEDGEFLMRVRGAVIRPIPEPRYRPGDQVFALPKQAIGIVDKIIWHLKRKQVYYLLTFNGKPSGRWYFETEIQGT
jgi:hypothetical protein